MNSLTGRSQWQDISMEEFSKMILSIEEKIPEESSYSYEAKYLFFEEPQSTDTTLYYGFSLSNQVKKQLFNMHQFGREIVQNNKVQIICDTAEHQIIINYPNEEYYKRKTTDDFALLLKSKCTAQKKSQGKNTIYALMFAKGARYKGAELWVGSDGMISKYILYTAIDVLDDSKEIDKYIHPRMEIHFFNYQVGKKVDEANLKNVNSFFLDLENKTLKEEYKDFEIIDLRNEIK
ncbi:MAG: hypothetical protein EP305_04500 [Bacteroidetes bacterium]|nr:MAG: hypothetical protein EP305_04500 [Bacteroidota bacterium]